LIAGKASLTGTVRRRSRGPVGAAFSKLRTLTLTLSQWERELVQERRRFIHCAPDGANRRWTLDDEHWNLDFGLSLSRSLVRAAAVPRAPVFACRRPR